MATRMFRTALASLVYRSSGSAVSRPVRLTLFMSMVVGSCSLIPVVRVAGGLMDISTSRWAGSRQRDGPAGRAAAILAAEPAGRLRVMADQAHQQRGAAGGEEGRPRADVLVGDLAGAGPLLLRRRQPKPAGGVSRLHIRPRTASVGRSCAMFWLGSASGELVSTAPVTLTSLANRHCRYRRSRQ